MGQGDHPAGAQAGDLGEGLRRLAVVRLQPLNVRGELGGGQVPLITVPAPHRHVDRVHHHPVAAEGFEGSGELLVILLVRRRVTHHHDLPGGPAVPVKLPARGHALEDRLGVVRPARDPQIEEELADRLDLGGEGVALPDGLVVVIAVGDEGQPHRAGDVAQKENQRVDAGPGLVDHGQHRGGGVHHDHQVEVALPQPFEIVEQPGEGLGVHLRHERGAFQQPPGRTARRARQDELAAALGEPLSPGPPRFRDLGNPERDRQTAGDQSAHRIIHSLDEAKPAVDGLLPDRLQISGGRDLEAEHELLQRLGPHEGRGLLRDPFTVEANAVAQRRADHARVDFAVEVLRGDRDPHPPGLAKREAADLPRRVAHAPAQMGLDRRAAEALQTKEPEGPKRPVARLEQPGERHPLALAHACPGNRLIGFAGRVDRSHTGKADPRNNHDEKGEMVTHQAGSAQRELT